MQGKIQNQEDQGNTTSQQKSQSNIVDKQQTKTNPKNLIQTKQGRKPPIQIKQWPVNKSNPKPQTINPFKIKPNTALETYHQHMGENYGLPATKTEVTSGSVQLQATKSTKKKPQGSAKFQEIATTMGAEYGVDTSSLKATHNSSFPATVNAEATIQGSKIDFAPNKDTEANIKHEVGHAIDNAKNGTPRGDKMVNGQMVDTTREVAVDAMMNVPLQRKAENARAVAINTGSNVLIQRTVEEAREYVERNGLSRPGKNLIELMAELYLEGSPEWNTVYDYFTNDHLGVADVDRALEAEISRLQAALPKLRKRIKKWRKKVDKWGIKRRKNKVSTGKIKRAKMMNAGGRYFRLYHTKTAPTRNEQEPGDQGKSAHFGKKQDDYFRSGAENPQRGILGLEGKNNQMGDVGFVNLLDELHSINNGKEKTPLLNKPMTGNLFGQIDFVPRSQKHPGPKLGAEINSFTYNQQISSGSDSPRYQPDASFGNPKEYLHAHEDSYFDEAWYLTRERQTISEDYEAELFAHYQQIVSKAAMIYGNKPGKINGKELKLVLASLGRKSNFFDYPAVIFQPDDKGKVKGIKDDIIKRWNKCSTIKMTERQSFGFLYPVINDLEKSIRIWPGQYQIEEFLSTLQKVITPDGAQKHAISGELESPTTLGGLPLLQNTLKRSMNLATTAVEQVQKPNNNVKLLFNRIASNYGKGLEILQGWDEWKIDVLFAEATQIIENLNEATLHLSKEYDQSSAQNSFEVAVLNHYLKHINQTDYRMESFYLTHSGQQASSSAVLFHEADRAFLKLNIEDRGPVYFETMTSKKDHQQIKLADPVYNFTHDKIIKKYAQEDISNANIYDITNLDPAKLIQVLAENSNPQITLYASLSKHFQFGTDSTNIGLVIHLQKNIQGKGAVKKKLGSYVPKGALAGQQAKLNNYVPAVPSELYHHAALLFDAQTGDSNQGNDPQEFFMGHRFANWQDTHTLEVANWVASDNQCGIHSLNHFTGENYSRENWFNFFRGRLSPDTSMILARSNAWLDQNNLIELATLARYSLAVYEFNQQYGKWALVAGNESKAQIHIGRVPHVSGGGNDHWVPLRKHYTPL